MSVDLLAWHVEHHGGAFETCLARVCAQPPAAPPARCGRCGERKAHENHMARVRARRVDPPDHDYQPPPPAADYGFVIDGTGEPGPRVPAWGFTTPPPPADPPRVEPGTSQLPTATDLVPAAPPIAADGTDQVSTATDLVPVSVEALARALHAARVDCNPLLPMDGRPGYEDAPEHHRTLHREAATGILAALRDAEVER